MPGTEALQAKVPEWSERAEVVRTAAGALAALLTTSGFLLLADRRFPEWMPDGEIVVLALGFLILSRFYSQKDRYTERYAEQAYLRAFRAFVVPGLGIVFAAVAHLAYMAGPEIPAVCWKPLLSIIGLGLVLTGALLWWRGVASLGIDYLVMLYVYHPQSRRLLHSDLYDLLRHPVYAAVMHISAGLALIHANWYSLLVAAILPLFFWGWILLFEEVELVRQLPAYAEYQKAVPAFAPAPRNLLNYWRTLITGRSQA